MKIVLKGGPHHGQTRIIGDAERQFSEDGSVYKITDETTDDGTAIFQYDEKASRLQDPGRTRIIRRKAPTA